MLRGNAVLRLTAICGTGSALSHEASLLSTVNCIPPPSPSLPPAQCAIDVDLNSLQFGLDAPFFQLLVDQRDRPTGPLPTLVAQVSKGAAGQGGAAEGVREEMSRW